MSNNINMTNKKVLNFIKSVKYLRDDVIKGYEKKFDEAIKLYENRKIEKQTTLTTIINNLRYKYSVDKGVKALQKYSTYEPAIGIKKTGSVYNPDRKNKQFHIMCKITLDVEYLSGKKNNRNKRNKETFSESRVITAKTLTDAKNIMLKDIEYDYNIEESWRRSTTKNISFSSVLSLKQEAFKSDVSTMRMKDLGTKILNYDSVKEFKSFLQTDKDFGTCVIDNIVGMYGKSLHITREQFIKFCSKYYNNNVSLLDYGLEVEQWDEKDGIDAKCLQSFCEYYDISHYCYDVSNQCVIKNISKNRNNESLCYFCINEHMYLINDNKIKKSLSEKAKDKAESLLKSSLFENNFKAKTNIYDELNIVENVDLIDIQKYESCIFMFTRDNGFNDLNQVFEDFIKIYKVVPSNIKALNHKISKFECSIDNIKYYFVIDSNTNGNKMNYKIVQKLCKKNKIEFKNQSFVSLINQLKDIFSNDVNKRVSFDKEFRKSILNRYNNKCNVCKEKVEEFHIDHIMPLSAGGSNDDDNLQVLCLKCHQEKTESEVENGIYKRLSDSESSFSKQVSEIINDKLSKSYAFVETLNKNKENKKVFSIDINKCRKNILYYQHYEYPVFTVMDSVKKYDGECGAGLYYIESDSYIPLRGNGWYYYPMVEYCLKEKIIESHQIKYVVLSSLSMPADYYNEFINFCYHRLGNYAKFSINSMIGAFNINTEKNINSSTIGVIKNSYDAYLKHFNTRDSFINSFEIDNEIYYHMYKDVKTIKYETESPIYNQIIQIENILIHQLKVLIESKNGTVIDLNTDACSCIFPDDVFPFKMLDDENLDNYFYDDKVPLYKLEFKDGLKHERCKKMIRTEFYSIDKLKWNEYEDVNDNDFEPLVETIIESEQSFHILGRAGTGKSTLIKQIQEKLNEEKKIYITLCPTNKACLVIKDAMTLCKFSNKFKNKHTIKNLNIDYVFVDEISMVHEIYYKFLLIIKQLKPKVRFIISGDFKQLPPVCDRVVDIDYKNSNILYELSDKNRLTLSTCRRANDKLFNICKNVKTIQKSDFDNKFKSINLCYTNKKRIEINKILMDKQVKKNGAGLKLKANIKNSNSQDVELFDNMPIISMKTDSKLGIVNNEMFTIKSIYRDIIEITNENKTIEISSKHFQHLFYVAYCITIHKSQGSTFDFDYTIHEWEKLDETLKYVALSRATKKNLINII